MNIQLPTGGIDVFAQAIMATTGRSERNDALPSVNVKLETRGLYDVVHLLVYCSDFVGDMVSIENTVLTLLKDLGWDPELPRVGAVLHISGSTEFVNAMTYCVTKQRLPHHGVRLSKDNAEAQESIDHLLKQCTHAVEFTSRRMATQNFTQQSHFATLAWSHGLSYLKFILNE
jgi:hypothetical protein